MHFKQLELFGFKSFAQRTCLHLEKGISAIVGPNGCGKSNIGDAVRWVLGEQKVRVLRGQHMEDVIFSGSDDRHPLGMAEVTLILDNSDGALPLDYSEVSITRRLFRSGESEYYLNKLPCRRKDVVELLMGSGIGADSYSLIEQGRIDLVLSSKPEERRYIFEDAAGIIKYKSRKDAALRKLERADANLLRLQDTIIEVRRQINSLKRQANAAQRYRQLRDELRSLELKLALLKYRDLDTEHTDLLTRTKQLSDQLAEFAAKQATEESELEKARLGMFELEKTFAHSQGQSRDYQSRAEKAESQIALLREKMSAIDEREKRNQVEIEEIQRSLEALNKEYTVAGDKEREALEQAAHAQSELGGKEAQFARLVEELSACERAIEKLRAVSLEKLNSKVNLQNELGAIEANLQTLSKRITRISGQKLQIDESVTRYENRLGETRNTIQSLRAALASLSSDISSLTETMTSKETQLEESILRHDAIRNSLSAARSKLSSLEELRDKFEGYEEGVRAVMLAKQQGSPQASGVVGTLAELLRGEREHEAALEAALGHRLQHIVVEDIDAARRCTELLESNRAGRASFVPLSLFGANGHVQFQIPFVEGAVGKAADMVSCDGRLRPLAEALLGSTLVVDSLDRALALVSVAASRRGANGDSSRDNSSDSGSSNGGPNQCDLVTLSGEAVSSMGIISAGNGGRGRGLLGRKNEIEELRVSIQKMTSEAEAENLKIGDLKHGIEQCRELLQKLRSTVNSHEVELARAERDLQQLDDNKKRDEQERDVLLQEHSLALTENQELAKQREELLLQIEHAKTVEAETNEKLNDANLQLNELRNRKDNLAADITNFKVNLSSLQLTCKTFRHEMGRLQSEMQEANRRITDKRREIGEGIEAKEQYRGEIETSRVIIQEIFEQKQALDAKIEKLGELKRQLTETIKEVDGNLKQTRSLVQRLSDQRHQLEISLAQTEEKVSFLKEKVLADYRLSMSDVAQEIAVEDGFDPQLAEQEAQRLREKIESMGAVNLIAIEEFEELQRRYDFLIQQEADLRKAKEALLGIIKKINETTQTMFTETFEQIRTHFHEIFRTLFGGGRANVYLLDPANPLESGIEISVHPPGKKPQSISVLSGGEKALTAIALLFAIFKTRPSPFCILDEVDAPLDDNNILRFARLVKMFSQDVQFVIVTHNKRSMELADVLYGVTMEERGVSQIVSVKLKKANAFEFLEPSVVK